MKYEELGWKIDNSYSKLPKKFFSKVKKNDLPPDL